MYSVIPSVGTLTVITSFMTMPFCQLWLSISAGTDAEHIPCPGLQIQILANDGSFVSVMSAADGDEPFAIGGWGGTGFAHVLPNRPKTNCRSRTSITPSGCGRLTSYPVEYNRLPLALK